MAKELTIEAVEMTGETIYSRIWQAGLIYNSSTGFELKSAANPTLWAVACTEDGTTGVFIGDFPIALPQGVYVARFYLQLRAGASVDDPQFIESKSVIWDGSQELDFFALPQFDGM